MKPTARHGGYEGRKDDKMREVRTERYEFSTERKPRGTGTWAFGNKSETVVWFFWGSYGDCKKMAVKKANEELGKYEAVYVLP